MSSISKRSFTAQEAVHIIMGWPMFRCIRDFVTIKNDDVNFEIDGKTPQYILKKYINSLKIRFSAIC